MWGERHHMDRAFLEINGEKREGLKGMCMKEGGMVV